MSFDTCEHKLRQLVIKAAKLRRKELGLSVENNITILYEEMAPLLGMPPTKISSLQADHLPRPNEMKDAAGNYTIPNKPCPKCGKLAFLGSICQSCKDALDDKGNVVYKSGYLCLDPKCGFVDEKTGEWISQRLSKMGVEVKTGTKESLGIKTKTDEGLK